jgi:hypothetical protein
MLHCAIVDHLQERCSTVHTAHFGDYFVLVHVLTLTNKRLKAQQLCCHTEFVCYV